MMFLQPFLRWGCSSSIWPQRRLRTMIELHDAGRWCGLTGSLIAPTSYSCLRLVLAHSNTIKSSTDSHHSVQNPPRVIEATLKRSCSTNRMIVKRSYRWIFAWSALIRDTGSSRSWPVDMGIPRLLESYQQSSP